MKAPIVKRTILIAAILAASSAAHATERGYHQTIITPPAAAAPGGDGGSGGAGGAAGSNHYRAFALGTSSSANPRTCYIHWASGIAFKHDVYCQLVTAGAPKAALALMCDQPDVRKAMALTGEFKCPEVATDDPYIQMRTK